MREGTLSDIRRSYWSSVDGRFDDLVRDRDEGNVTLAAIAAYVRLRYEQEQ